MSEQVGAYSDMLRAENQHQKAIAEEQKFKDMLDTYITEETAEESGGGTAPDPYWLGQRENHCDTETWEYD